MNLIHLASKMTMQRHVLSPPVIVEEDKLEFGGVGATVCVRDPQPRRETKIQKGVGRERMCSEGNESNTDPPVKVSRT